MPWCGERWAQYWIFSKAFRALDNCDARGYRPGQADELRGKRWTIHDRRRLGFC
jgi:hypothetical protein